MAPIATMPTTTPATIPVVFAFDFLLLAAAAAESDAASAGAVTVTTVVPTVMTDGAAVFVVDGVEDAVGEEDEEELSEAVALAIVSISSVPVAHTVK